jgi:hypothetical protein
MAQSNICKAIVQQGPRKDQSCERAPKENGYCVYHQRNYKYEESTKDGKHLCGMFFRGCNSELSKDDIELKYKICTICRKKKYNKGFPCQYDKCKFSIVNQEDKYCRKHIRQFINDDAEEKEIIYCNVSRGCFQPIIHGTKCNTCEQHEKDTNAHQIITLREKHNISMILSTSTLQKKQEEITISVPELWRCVQKNAYSRALLFTISETDFEKLIVQSCYYCGFNSSSRLNGIDRIDNNKGYILQNCISCCKMCNLFKNMLHPIEFLDKIDGIYSYTTSEMPILDTIIKKWKGYLSTSVRKSYNAYKSDSKRRNIEFLLSETEYNKLIQGSCYLCGISSSQIHTNGIDRIDSSIRCYSIDNCKTCCGHCNVMKGIISYSDFIKKCIQIHKHACNRLLFEEIPVYNDTYCRNEYYTAEDVYDMMTNGKYMKYIEWCQEKDKTSDFISAMNEICHLENIMSNKANIIVMIQSEQEKERSRRTSIDELKDKKSVNCRSVYIYLTQGKKDEFMEWYQSTYYKTSLFDTQLEAVIKQLPILSKENGIESCRKLMYDEKNRRVIQERREREKKVEVYSSSIPNHECSPKNEIILPLIVDPIIQKVKSIQEQKGYIKVSAPKQWKTKQIYDAIKNKKEADYKQFCESNNDMTKIKSWEDDWVTFIASVDEKPQEDAEKAIKEFVNNLRRIRHNTLCASKSDVVEREDREQWPATTVVKAFLEGKMDKFKAYTETHTSESLDDPKWIKRWSTFIESLNKNRDNALVLKELCSKFMTAQRTKKYRLNKKE